MTYIAKPAVADTEVLSHIGRSLIVTEGNQTKMRHGLKLLTEDGGVHDLSFNQVLAMLNVYDSNSDVDPPTPLQYLVAHYDLKDMVELGKDDWVVPEYDIVLMADTKTVRLEGKLTRVGWVNKEFSFALGGFDFFQQLSLARCIAGVGERFQPVIGTYDVSYRFHVGPEGSSIDTDIGV